MYIQNVCVQACIDTWEECMPIKSIAAQLSGAEVQ